MREQLSLLGYVLPCDNCVGHFDDRVTPTMLDAAVQSPHALQTFYFNLHNDVNASNGKEPLSWEQAQEQWTQGDATAEEDWWTFLHAVAFNKPNDPKVLRFLNLALYFFPCSDGTCGAHIRRFAESTDNSGDVPQWLYDVRKQACEGRATCEAFDTLKQRFTDDNAQCGIVPGEGCGGVKNKTALTTCRRAQFISRLSLTPQSVDMALLVSSVALFCVVVLLFTWLGVTRSICRRS